MDAPLLATDDLPSLVELDAELMRRSFVAFIPEAWVQVDPSPLVWGWHIDAMAEHLQAVTEGQIRDLLINIPPGHAKSMIVSVLWPAWVWTRKPEWQVLTASYDGDLAIRDAVKCRTLMDSPWYRERFRRGWDFKTDQNVKSYYVNTARGHRLALSVGGAGTGWRSDAQLVDDPLKAADAYSQLKRDAALRWYTETMSSRFNDMKKRQRVVIMQRLHEQDLSGYLLEHGNVEHLCLPSEFEPARRKATCIGWTDPRKEEGELLFPELFPKEVLTEAKSGDGMGETAYAGQHQQRPAPAEGNVFKNEWWRWWRFDFEPEVPELKARTVVIPTPADWREWFSEVVLSVDCAFKDTKRSDRVALGAIGQRGANRYLLALRWERMSFTRTKRELVELALQFSHLQRAVEDDIDAAVTAILNQEKREETMRGVRPWYTALLVEDKANGSAVLDEFRETFPGMLAIDPEGGKEARAHAASPQAQAGNVILPLHYAKRAALLAELSGFPLASHDDAVDMLTQALNWMRGRGVITEDIYANVGQEPGEDSALSRFRNQRF